LARTTLPVNFYTEWYWKIDLHNLLHFLQLRLDRHAQYEIRVYAEAIAAIVKQWCPLTWEAFEDYRLNAYSLSAPALAVVQRVLAGEGMAQEGSGLSQREWDELWGRLAIPDSTRSKAD
jgi:thymidylate synthase (FAD)